MSIRPIKRLIKAKPTMEGAGVHLRRALVGVHVALDALLGGAHALLDLAPRPIEARLSASRYADCTALADGDRLFPLARCFEPPKPGSRAFEGLVVVPGARAGAGDWPHGNEAKHGR